MAELFTPGTPVDFSKSIDRSNIKARNALVTGGASGIGLAICHALVESGAQVTIADIDEAAGWTVLKSFQSKGHHVNFIKTDVTSWEDQVSAFEKAADSSPFQTIDIVITCAGLLGKLDYMPSLQELDKPMKPPTDCIDVNFYGTYYSTMLALWYFAHSPPNPAKQLLLLSSASAYSAPLRDTMVGDYPASKSGVRGLFGCLHPFAQKHGGSRMNMLCPTFVDTPMMPRDRLAGAQAAGFKTAVTADVVEGAMRCLCDGSVNGRSVFIGGGEANGGPPGSANFDMRDDISNHWGGKAIWENMSRCMSLPGVVKAKAEEMSGFG